MPGTTAVVLLMFIAAWAIVGRVLRIIAAIQLRKRIEGEWLLGLSGLMSVVFGILLVAMPAAGLLTMAWLIGVWAIAFGIVMAALAFRLRRAGEDAGASPAAS